MLTNEELMYTYKTRAENEEEILEAIFRKNEGLILSIAKPANKKSSPKQDLILFLDKKL